MEKTLILGNKPEKWWIKDLGETDVLSVPNFSVGKNSDISNFVRELPKDIDCVVIDADSLYTENIELPLDLALQIRLMLRECLHTSLSSIIIVSDLSIEAFRDYGVKSMILMTRKVSLVQSEVVCEVIRNSAPLSPGEYVEGFLNLIKIEPQQKIEGRHSIANEWVRKDWVVLSVLTVNLILFRLKPLHLCISDIATWHRSMPMKFAAL